MTNTMPLDILIVDDEPLARQRLRTLLAECDGLATGRVVEAGDAAAAEAQLGALPFHVVLLDVHMPGRDGLALARAMADAAQAAPPAVIFVTAHGAHALQAFELDAADYLTKPVRRERLAQALQKAQRLLQARRGPQPDAAPPAALATPGAGTLAIHDRGRTQFVPLAEVVYLKAELKYVTVRTAARSYILDSTLQELEERHAAHFLRVHRNALVARSAVRALERHYDALEGEGWVVRLQGVDERLPVSRRQLQAVREALGG